MKKQPFLTIIMIVLCYTHINAKTNMTCTEHMNNKGRIPKKSVVFAIIIEKYSIPVNPRPHGAKAPRYI